MKERMKTLRCLSGPKAEKHLGVSQPSPEVLFALKNPGLGWREWEMWQSPGLEPLRGRRISETRSTGGALGRSSGRAGKWAALVPKHPGRRLWKPDQAIPIDWHSTILVESDTREKSEGASLVAQWLGIRLPMQGTWVRALVREDPTCHRSN